MIDYIEPSGWLTSNLDELTNFSGFKKTEIENVLFRMQTFEPNGVFARNLKECLIIQLKNDEKLTDGKRKIIENLELLGEGNLKELQKITNLREEEVKESIKNIRLLNPKPGTKYSEENNNIFNPASYDRFNNTKKKIKLKKAA